MNRNYKQERGFTLTEILVAMAIFAIIFVAALLIYDRSNRVFKESVESSDTQQQTRAAFDRLSSDLRMMGFDFDRDGVPTTGNREQQPDEQLEFIHEHAVTIRGNFDYDSDSANQFGREEDYEPPAGQFSVVTTANPEIVTYVLRSDSGTNNDEIVFYADTRKPRNTFTGGSDEQKVTIPGVNLCTNGCDEPPYTLYRVTLKDEDLQNPGSASAFNFTPVANNIRSLGFTYYSSVPALPTDEVTPNLGVGQFKISAANSATDIAARNLRAQIKAVRLRIVGMTDAPVSGFFEDPVEMKNPDGPHPTAMRHRQFPLEAVIQPRNVGVRGMEEFDVKAPQKPTLTQVCAGSCGLVRVEWNPPAAGTVDSYTIFWDTSTTGNCSTCAFAGHETVGPQTFFYAPVPDPSKTWYFKVSASNSFGSSEPSNESIGIVPINHTKPVAPAMISATGGDPDGPPAIPNDIRLVWQLSKANVGTANDTCGEEILESPSYREAGGFRVYRSPNAGFDPASDPDTVTVFDGLKGAPGAPTVDDGSGLVTYVDTSGKLACVPYYYRVQVVERCDTAALNLGGDTDLGVSDLSDEIPGQTVPAYPPRRPLNLFVSNDQVVDDGTGVMSAVVELTWDEVVQDTGDPSATTPVPAAPILVQNYIVERTEPDGNVVTWPVTVDGDIGNGTVTDTETITPSPDPAKPHLYRVKAVVCNGEDGQLESIWSDSVKYPCSQMFIQTSGVGVLDGSGQSDDPYVVGSSIELQVTTTKAIQTISATMDGSPLPVTGIAPTERYVSVTAPSDGAPHAAIISFTDIEGCTVTRSVWVLSAPSNCCLAPFKIAVNQSFEPTVIEVVNATTLRVRFVNVCGDSLTLEKIRLRFPQSKTPLGDPSKWTPKIATVTFPEQGGGTVSENFGGVGANDGVIVDMTKIPSAETTIPGGSSSYSILVTFTGMKPSDTLTAGSSGNLYLQGVCVVYSRPSDIQSTFCKIAQEADSLGCQF